MQAPRSAHTPVPPCRRAVVPSCRRARHRTRLVIGDAATARRAVSRGPPSRVGECAPQWDTTFPAGRADAPSNAVSSHLAAHPPDASNVRPTGRRPASAAARGGPYRPADVRRCIHRWVLREQRQGRAPVPAPTRRPQRPGPLGPSRRPDAGPPRWSERPPKSIGGAKVPGRGRVVRKRPAAVRWRRQSPEGTSWQQQRLVHFGVHPS